VEAMKQHYNVVAIGLIQKLEQWFPTQDLMNAIGVIILKFGCSWSWAKGYGSTIVLASRLAQNNFSSYLCLMKHYWCNSHFFQVYYAMSLLVDYNPCTKMWTNLANNQLLSH
jgi:hypothetical protein